MCRSCSLGKRLLVDLVIGARISLNSLLGAAPSRAMFYTHRAIVMPSVYEEVTETEAHRFMQVRNGLSGL